MLYLILHDVTGRRVAEDVQAASERRLRHVMAATGKGLWDWDIPGNHVSHNARWLEITGITDDLREHSFEVYAALIHPDDLARNRESLSQAPMSLSDLTQSAARSERAVHISPYSYAHSGTMGLKSVKICPRFPLLSLQSIKPDSHPGELELPLQQRQFDAFSHLKTLRAQVAGTTLAEPVETISMYPNRMEFDAALDATRKLALSLGVPLS